MNSSINYIIKGIGIIAVITGHTRSPLSSYIYSWHMPLFFIASGYYLNYQTPYFETLKKASNSLLLPFIYYGSFGILAEILKRMLLHREPINIFEQVYQLYILIEPSNIKTYSFILWFLPVLFWGRIIAYTLGRRIHIIISFFCSVVLSLLLLKYPISIPLGLDKAILVVPYVLSGSVIASIDRKFLTSYLSKILSIFVIVTSYFYAPSLDIANKSFSFPMLNYAYPIFIYLSMFCILSSFYKYQFLINIGRYSFFIYIFHVYTNNAGFIISEKFHLSWYGTTIISIVLLFILFRLKESYKFIKRLFPYV